jgi:hypothetical protein
MAVAAVAEQAARVDQQLQLPTVRFKTLVARD